MPVIPTYVPKERLDGDTRGMPRVSLSSADFEAQQKQGAALAGLGSAIGGLGQAGEKLAAHVEQRETEQNNFTSKLQQSALSTDLQSILEEKQRGMSEDGRGFTDSVMPDLDKAANARFALIPEGKLREQAMQSWEVLHRPVWAKEAAKSEIVRRDGFQTSVLDKEQNRVLETLMASPDQGRTLIDQHAAFERDASVSYTHLTLPTKRIV